MRARGVGATPATATGSASAQVFAVSGGFLLQLTVEGAQGRAERSLATTDCGALADATALLTLLALDPEAAAAQQAASAPAPQVTVAAPAQVTPAPAIPTAERKATKPTPALPPASAPNGGGAPRTTLGPPPPVSRPLAIAVAAGVESGALPALTPLLAASVSAPAGSLRLGVAAQVLWPSRGRAGSLSGARVELFGVLGQLRACTPVLRRDLEVGPCAAVELGALRGKSSGVSDPGSDQGFWLAAGGGLSASAALGAGLRAELTGDVQLPLLRPAFLVHTATGAAQLHEVEPVSFRLALGIAREFP